MPGEVRNPYWFDTADQAHCAICAEPIKQPARGPARVFCARSECRRAGAERRYLARAWDEGYRAGARGGPAPPLPPGPPKRHWTTEFQAGAEAVKRAVLKQLPTLEIAVEQHGRYRTPDTMKSVKRAMTGMRQSLRLGTHTPDDRPLT